MALRAAIEPVLGQMQLGGAAPKRYIERQSWPEGVLPLDLETESAVPVDACPRVGYMQDRDDALHRAP